MESRVPQTQGYFRAQAFIEEQVKGLGYTPQRHSFKDIRMGSCTNLYTECGPQEGPRILIGAHYESRSCSGLAADDNASAVAVSLELLKRVRPNAPMTFVYFDVEENFGFGGMHGSKAFSKFYEKPIEMVLIMDLVGGSLAPSFDDTYFQFGNAWQALNHTKLSFFHLPLKVLEPLGSLGARSDYHAFRKQGIPYSFISSGTPWYYHSPYDTPERLHYEKMKQLVNALTEKLNGYPSPVRHEPSWQQWPQFIEKLLAIPALNSPFLQSLKRKTPNRFEIIKMYKEVLYKLRTHKESLWSAKAQHTKIG